MHEFYKKVLLACLGLLVGSILVGYLCLRQSNFQASLLPAGGSPISWRAQPSWDAQPGGVAILQLHEDKQRLRFGFTLPQSAEQRYATVDLLFLDREGKPMLADLSRYSTISLLITCSPANTLMLSVPTREERGLPEEYLNYRIPQTYFSCDEHGSRVDLDLTRLETPQWWFYLAKRDLSQHAYKLDKVPKISISSTFQSPAGTASTVDIGKLELKGRDRRYLVLLMMLLLSAWGGFAWWFFRQRMRVLIAAVRGKLQRDLPFIAYQQLSFEPHRDKEKMSVLRCISIGYADPALDLERVVEQTGVNRAKINDILKAELGLTFNAYLKKLRLTEASRLLAENNTATVAEIAYSVGYGNVPYFNKLFKEEYGCTPTAFRRALAAQEQPPAPASQ